MCASAPKLLVNSPKNLVKLPRTMKIIIFSCTHGTLLQFKLSRMDFPDGPAAIHSNRTTCSGFTQSAGSNELINPENSLKNRHFFTYSFLGFGPAVFPDSVISSHACIVFLSEASSSSHVIFQHCASARTPALNGPRDLVKHPQKPKSIMMRCMRETLLPPNHSDMDFPDGAAAIH